MCVCVCVYVCVCVRERDIHTHTHPFNGPFSGTTQVSRYQKDRTNLDFTEARDSEWQWRQMGHMQVCTSLQTDNHASIPPLRVREREREIIYGIICASVVAHYRHV